MNKILIIAPHPDDEILGCGGTIARCSSAGDEVFVLIVTKGDDLFDSKLIEDGRRETIEADQYLGVKQTFFSDLPSIKLDTLPQYQINEKISDYIKKVCPNIIFIPFYGDLNQDHQIVHNACIVASRPGLSSVKEIYCYEAASSTNWNIPGISVNFTPNVFFDITDTIEKKKKAFQIFKSQIRKFPHPRSTEFIESLSMYRGASAGVKNAEAFMQIRKVL